MSETASNSNNPFIKSFWLGKSEQLSVENYMNFWQSCLSDHAKTMILIDDDDEPSVESNYKESFCEKGFLTQNAIGSLLDSFYSYDTSDETAFMKASVKIKILAKMATFFLDSKIFSSNDFLNLYKEEISWSGYFDLYFEQDFYTALLLGISSLERILGCIIFTIRKETSLIPNLIRDLLISPPLVQVLGKDIVFYLRCLIGPPSSMNLRNILWHGFICSKEFLPVPARWYSALIIITIMRQEHRMNTVEVGQYFLTLDIILEKYISCEYFSDINDEKESVGKNPKNLIYDEFCGGTMDLILDLFIHTDGPRLRNRIAHGEVNHLILSSSPNPLYPYFISLLILLWTKYRIKFTNTKSKDNNNIDENVVNDEDDSQTINNTYENWISHYQSRFHPIPMLWKECTQLILNIWKCWKVTDMIINMERFILGDWINDLDSTRIEFNNNNNETNNLSTKTFTQSNARLNSLFEQQFLMEILKENNISNVIQNCCAIFKSNKCGNNNVNNSEEPIYWCQRNYTKEDAKFINFQRVVINKANDGVEKLQNILESIHTSTSLSSRKRKNVQSLFTLFPSMLQQLYFALKCLYAQEYSTSSLIVSKQQKSMLAVLVFIERWCGHCLEGRWKNIAEVFEEMKKTIKKNNIKF
ncbi:2343_t:CDS:2 [Diversispora eburnea]|uniref:2343_t:CDS:1 n=1 Tax=Diversispora eburnea TaxID=1213867 RepID=A0A9N8V9X6_9GLOM|nr:2343_t:CDS:2 [Diversispora eburnea]